MTAVYKIDLLHKRALRATGAVAWAKDHTLKKRWDKSLAQPFVRRQQPPDGEVRTVQWKSGLLEGKVHKTGRYTFTTGRGPGKFLPSGLLGPVGILVSRK